MTPRSDRTPLEVLCAIVGLCGIIAAGALTLGLLARCIL